MKNIKLSFKGEAARKILLFFNENPHCIDTAKGISLWINSDACEVQRALNLLVKEKILVNHKTVSTSAYAYTNNRDMLKKIEKYLKNVL